MPAFSVNANHPAGWGLAPCSGHGICGYAAASGSVVGAWFFVDVGAGIGAAGVSTFEVVAADQPANHFAAAVGQWLRSCRISRLRVALNDSASALSVLDPTPPKSWVTPRFSQSFAQSFGCIP